MPNARTLTEASRNPVRFIMGRPLMAVTVLLVSAAVGLLSSPAICAAFRNLEMGKETPDFTLKDMAGMDHTLSAERGKVVILCFVKPDQDRSIKAMNALTRVHGTLKDNGLQVFAVTSDTEDTASLQSLADKLDLGYPILLDEGKEVYGAYGLFMFPATAFIDPDGNYVHEYSSFGSDYQEAVMDQAKVMLGLMSEEDLVQATEKHEIVELSPERKEAERNLQMAKVLLQRGFGSKAIPKLEKALELDPSLTEARILAGEIYLEEEKTVEARAQFERALTDNPKDTRARVGLGSVLIAEGDLDGAEAELKKAVTLNPDPALALYRLGQVYEKKGDTQKAMETYRGALESQLKKVAKAK